MKYLQSLVNKNAYQNFRKTSLVVSSWLCAVGGFVADVLQPIAPFAFYLFLLSLVGLVIIGILFAIGKKDLLGALVLSIISIIATGAFTLMQQGEKSEEIGIVASTIPGVEALQKKLGIIEEKLDDIKQDTETIISSTTRIESKSDEMLQSLDVIKEGIGNASADGIIRNPASPEDHYHNARIHELGGDYAAARRSYLEYFKSDLPKIDPHLRFIAFLKVQEGTAGARETYNEVTARSQSPVPPFARLLLLPPDNRKAGLKDYFENHTDFAPAAYQLSLEFSQLRLGSQTISDKREEQRYLKAFQAADEAGGLLRYLIDQELATEWRSDAEQRLTILENGLSSNVLENPVSLNWMAHNAGWNGNIQISEPALDILWNIKGQTSATSTGDSGYNDPNTGRPAPRAFFTLPKNQQNTTIEIRYLDANGNEQGPFEFAFTAQKESDDGNRRILEMTSTSWVSFRDYEGNTLLYFSHLLTYRGSLATITYGLDTDTPDQEFDFPAWDQPGFAQIDGSFPIYLAVPNNTRFATIQLTYKNGDKSAIVRFDR
jgi:hypothetical protein